MKKINLIAVLSLISLLIFSSCENSLCIKGQGDIITETITIDKFSGIDLAHACDVVISQGNSQEVVVEGHQNIINRLKTNVNNDVWSIDLQKGCYLTYDLTVYITVPEIDKVYVSGAGDVLIEDFTNQDKLDLKISGAGKVELNKFGGADDLSVNISGSGKIIGNNNFDDLQDLEIKISGSGKYDAYPIETKDCYVNISGSGNCKLTVTDNLEANISGAGSVHYKGNPYITTDITGAGNVVNEN